MLKKWFRSDFKIDKVKFQVMLRIITAGTEICVILLFAGNVETDCILD